MSVMPHENIIVSCPTDRVSSALCDNITIVLTHARILLHHVAACRETETHGLWCSLEVLMTLTSYLYCTTTILNFQKVIQSFKQ